jgi:putative N6-adenine-specific DNA methylase
VTPHRYFATCARGLEPVLADELRALGSAEVAPGRGGVAFADDTPLLYRANLWLRTAVRVLVPVLEAPAASPEELYAAVQTVDWSQYLTPEQTLAVDCNVRDSRLTHSLYAAQKTKDAICDQFVARCGRRPSVDLERPMVGLNLHVHRDRAVLSLDSSGDSLHKRGYRPIQTVAPLNEALAAALVLLTAWNPETAFVDPMCGSGTLPIEAAWVALRRPPGLTRRHFGFQGWLDYNPGLWADVRDEARRGVLPRLPAPVLGSDVRADAVGFAERNARAAGIGHLLRFERRDVRDLRVPDGPPGAILCNPPYGERIGEEQELRDLYRTLGQVFRRQPYGWRAFVFTGNPALAEQVGLPVARTVPLFNGRIPCQLIEYELA